MKTFLFAALIISWLRCNKKLTGDSIKGKLIYRSCASTVVEVLDSKHYSLSVDNWQQSPAKPTYNHVFAVANTCSFGEMKEGQTFTFVLLNNDPKMKDCVVCALYDNPPTKTQIIKVVEKDTIK